ncbi:hypothetical protein FM106_28730 [Brachybacterium faecium]|nr:hypothetical protein FM106_28730 [Brachybacterium faecium]
MMDVSSSFFMQKKKLEIILVSNCRQSLEKLLFYLKLI